MSDRRALILAALVTAVVMVAFLALWPTDSYESPEVECRGTTGVYYERTQVGYTRTLPRGVTIPAYSYDPREVLNDPACEVSS